MTRLWQFPVDDIDATRTSARSATPPSAGDPPGTGETERYAARPARPVAQLAVRVGLWGAVVLGAVGGIVSVLRPPPAEVRTVAAASDAGASVPAPVARRAEQVVEAWLTATEEDGDRLATLFVEPPSLEGATTAGLRIGPAAAISGRRLEEGYWAVTVEVEVTESVPVVTGEPGDAAPGGGAGEAAPSGVEERTTTWFLEVPIVGQVDGGLQALATPAVLPAGPEATTGWRPTFEEPQPPTEDDPTTETVEGFLRALLAGAGDPSRYVAPGVTARAADPAVFADVEVVLLGVDQVGVGEHRVFAEVSALTVSGARQRFSYELIVVERVDRLEITRFAGAPTLVAGAAEPPDSTEPAGSADEQGVN